MERSCAVGLAQNFYAFKSLSDRTIQKEYGLQRKSISQ